MDKNLPKRKMLPHSVPYWLTESPVYFFTVCARPRGENQLCKKDISEKLWESAYFYMKNGDWWIYCFLLMPDHIHALIGLSMKTGLADSVASWKRYAARNLKINWQRDFFDHRLRRQESIINKTQYILNNPVRAGLTGSYEQWPYYWGFNSDGRSIR